MIINYNLFYNIMSQDGPLIDLVSRGKQDQKIRAHVCSIRSLQGIRLFLVLTILKPLP